MKAPLLCILLSVFAFTTQAQSPQQQNDSVCQLVKKYFNARAADQLYGLTGQAFRQQLSAERFEIICSGALFPLGAIKEAIPEKYEQGISFYKAVFPSMPMRLLISLDSSKKIETLLFQPYKDERTRKSYPVPSSNPLSTAVDKAVDSIARSYIQLAVTAGLSIGILKDGKTSYYGYGETAKGSAIIPDAATIFEIGSITKTFTATLLCLAVGEGKVRLDDPVNKYLRDSIPSLQYHGRVVMLQDLSNHTSAIPRMPSNFQQEAKNGKDPYGSYTVRALYSYLSHLQLTREPGKEYEYSNTAVGLLGIILQNRYHKSYEELVTQYICQPLGMGNTRITLRKADSARFAKGYDESGAYNGPWNLPAAFAGAGAVRSNASDLLKYANAQLSNASAPLAAAIRLTHDTTFSSKEATIGLGWHYIRPAGKAVLFHSGGTGGYSSYLAIDTGQKIAVVLLSNCAMDTRAQGDALMKWLEQNGQGQ